MSNEHIEPSDGKIYYESQFKTPEEKAAFEAELDKLFKRLFSVDEQPHKSTHEKNHE